MQNIQPRSILTEPFRYPFGFLSLCQDDGHGKHLTSRPMPALIFCTPINVLWVVRATNVVPFFTNFSYNDVLFTGSPDQETLNGTCPSVLGKFSKDANSVDPTNLDSCCAGSL